MNKRAIVTIFVALLLGGQLPAYSQDKSKPVDKGKLIDLYGIKGTHELPEYHHQDAVRQDQQVMYVNQSAKRRFAGVMKSSRFWILMGAVGGMVAAIVMASTADTDTRALPYPSSAMGPIDKNK